METSGCCTNNGVRIFALWRHLCVSSIFSFLERLPDAGCAGSELYGSGVPTADAVGYMLRAGGGGSFLHCTDSPGGGGETIDVLHKICGSSRRTAKRLERIPESR